jgi:hypothetical protein
MPRIPELPDFDGAIATDDEFAVWDKSADITYGATLQQVAAAVGALSSTVTEAPDNTTPYVRQDEEWAAIERVFSFAASDEETALTTGDGKLGFRMPFAMTLTAVRASVSTAPVGSTIVVDINEAGSTILSTKLSIDASEKTSTTAATAAVISDTALADDAEITIDIDQIGSGTAGAGLKVVLIGSRV